MRTLTPIEVAERLRLSRNAVYPLLADGTIPARRIGGVWRVREDDLDGIFDTPAQKRQRRQRTVSIALPCEPEPGMRRPAKPVV